MKRHATTIVLLFLAVGLGLYLWLDRDKVTEGERKRRENNVFVAWRREDLSRVEIAHEGESIVLERDPKKDSTWRMTSPVNERVDQDAAERLLTTLEFATRVRKVEEGGLLGFEAPRASGSVTMGTIVMRFALGAVSPRPEGSSYFRVDSGAPFVASKELTDALLASANAYRDRTVIPYLSTELARFEVKGGFAIARLDDRSFKIDGLGLLASRGALDKIWGALAEIRAEAFPKDADADRLTAQPRLTILMTPRDAGKVVGELLIGEACPGHPNDVVVLRKQPTRIAACAPRGALDALLAITPTSLVDAKPFSFRHDEVEELRLSGDGLKTIEIARRGTSYHQREPVDRELTSEEADAANFLLTRFENTVGTVVDQHGAFTAVARARVRAGEHEETIEVAKADGDSVMLRRVRDDARLKVNAATARLFMPRETTTRSAAFMKETRHVKHITLRCGVPQELADDGGGLKLVEPAGYETDGSITELVDGIVKGKALMWTADADDGSFGLSPNGCRVVLSFDDGNAPVTVRFGAEGEGGVYGTIEGKPEIFVAAAGTYALVKRTYVSHAVLRVEAAKIESVKITSTDPKVVFTQDEGLLRTAAAGLYADRVLSLGSADIGRPEIEITIAVAEGGPPKRVTCGPVDGLFRKCSTPNVKAIFAVLNSALSRFVARTSDAAP